MMKISDPLLVEMLAGQGSRLADAETLPAGCYTSQAFFDLEREQIFRREWLAIGHVAQVLEQGDYFTVDILDELLLVVRDQGEIRVMSRVCLHRWAPVVEGWGRARRFSCPFHRWTYDLTGQLVNAPLMEQACGFDPATNRLPQVRHEVVGGTIFITFSETAASVRERLSDWEEAVSFYKMADLRIAFSSEITLACNWKIATETFMEAYHHIGPHARSLEPSFPAALHWADDSHAGWTAGHGAIRETLPTPSPPEAGTGFPFFPGLSEQRMRRSLCHLIYPNHALYLSLDRISWVTFVPVAPGKTRWIRHVLVPIETLAIPNFEAIVEDAKRRLRSVNEEDIAVNEMQQRGAASSFAKPGRLSHLEKPVWQLANYVREQFRLG